MAGFRVSAFLLLAAVVAAAFAGPLGLLDSNKSTSNSGGQDFLMGLVNALLRLHVSALNNVPVLSPLLSL